MARLKGPPKKMVYEPSDADTEAEAAAADEQLLVETELHSPVATAPPPSAVLGASILNAARIDPTQSSLAGDMARRPGGGGKLRRVTIAPKGPRQNLARRGDLYDIELSPEKGKYALPEKVNHKKLKVTRKKNKNLEQGRAEQDVMEDLAQVQVDGDNDNDVEPPLPSSPPKTSKRSLGNSATTEKIHPQVRIPVHPQVRIPVRKSTEQRSAEGPMVASDNADTGIGELSKPGPVGKHRKPRKQTSSGTAKLSQQVPDKTQKEDSNSSNREAYREEVLQHEAWLLQQEASEQARISRETEEKRKRMWELLEQSRISEEKRRKMWVRWQALHIARMQCEPNTLRRQKLTITPLVSLEDTVERDANGFEFERLPVFTPRHHPPQHSGSTRTDNHDWTEEEETALLEGLQHCTGPRVFENIFKRFCHPNGSPHAYRGALRDCSVAEITARAARFRVELHKLYQDNGWQIPEWVRNIPVWP